jgi:hypothetical protein
MVANMAVVCGVPASSQQPRRSWVRRRRLRTPHRGACGLLISRGQDSDPSPLIIVLRCRPVLFFGFVPFCFSRSTLPSPSGRTLLDDGPHFFLLRPGRACFFSMGAPLARTLRPRRTRQSCLGSPAPRHLVSSRRPSGTVSLPP